MPPPDADDVLLHFIDPAHPLYAGELELRFRVLREPLGRPRESVRFPFEDRSVHLVAQAGEGGPVVGCVLFHPEDARGGRLFQMAVTPALQGKGLGQRLVRALEAELVRRGHGEVHLHARAHVVPFYERLGYRVYGEPFEEVGVPHRHMRRALGEGGRGAARFTPGHVLPEVPPDDGLLVLADGLDVVVAREGAGGVRVPTLAEARAFGDGVHLLGTLEGRACLTAPLAPGAALPTGWERVPARSLYGAVDEALFGVVGRALAVAEWDVTHRFCGRCGTPTERPAHERVKRCPRCGLTAYPRIAPAVIVLIERAGGREVLLARNASFPNRFFSTLAGFVEPGEALEETVAREVREEVGVEVEDVTYFGSQPWPFGRSLMVGFTARWAGGELRPDTSEIAEAHWFTRDTLPPLPPPLSIARRLIDAWLARPQG